jgi:hypothetical protein
MKPLARRDGLVIRSLAGETLVYDLERHQAHCLNPAAASVFRLCDGGRSPEEIASLLGEPADPDVREAVVAAALGQLAEAQLLAADVVAPPAPGPAAPAEAASASRRELLRRVGTALLAPAIVSIVAPTAAQAASAGCVYYDQCLTYPTGTHCWYSIETECPTNTCQHTCGGTAFQGWCTADPLNPCGGPP